MAYARFSAQNNSIIFVSDEVQGLLNCSFDGTTCGYIMRPGNQFFTWQEAPVANVTSAWRRLTPAGYPKFCSIFLAEHRTIFYCVKLHRMLP